jgi:hypothetical protein
MRHADLLGGLRHLCFSCYVRFWLEADPKAHAERHPDYRVVRRFVSIAAVNPELTRNPGEAAPHLNIKINEGRPSYIRLVSEADYLPISRVSDVTC